MNGITYELSIPDASQQNGMVECAIQTIECIMHAMLVNGNLPPWFWPLSAQASVHVRNHIPHPAVLPDTTPFKHWVKKHADLSHLRPFGALVTARKTNSDTLNKAAECGEEGRFVGYTRDAKGFPTSLPSLPPLQLLWDDMLFDLEDRFLETDELKRSSINIVLREITNRIQSDMPIKFNHTENILPMTANGHNTMPELNPLDHDQDDDIVMQDSDIPIASQHPQHSHRLPARYIVN
ncbi:hypothetical protein GYMLUDRAFT_55595 [Collybiopsis luxurians FD-317 M1]|nr:hypothetical protein GYMLUDRAFT_55595 [Collybiopsis luxurians FD-317 M1]